MIADYNKLMHESAYGQYMNDLIMNEAMLDDAIQAILEAPGTTAGNTQTPTVNNNNGGNQQQGQSQQQQQNNNNNNNGGKAKKGLLQRLKEFLFGTNRKIGEMAEEAVQNIQQSFNANWLNENKNIIMQSAIKNDDYMDFQTNPDMAIPRCQNFMIPQYNEQEFIKLCAGNKDEKFVKKCFGNDFKYVDTNKKSLADQFKDYFKGYDDSHKPNNEGTTVRWDSAKLTEQKENMFNFCMDLGGIRDAVKKDRATLDSTIKSIGDRIDSIGNANAGAGAHTRNTSQNVAANMNLSAMDRENDQYFNNSTIISGNNAFVEAGPGNANAQSPTSGGGDQQPPAQDTSGSSGLTGSNVGTYDADQTNQIKDMVDVYSRVTRTAVAARLTAILAIHKEYMDWFRFHVQNNGGTPEPPPPQQQKPKRGRKPKKNQQPAQQNAQPQQQ